MLPSVSDRQGDAFIHANVHLGPEGLVAPSVWAYSQDAPIWLYAILAFALFPYPTRWRGRGHVGRMFNLPEGIVTDNIEKAFLAAPSIRRIIVWQQVGLSNGPRKAPPTPRDRLLARLPAGWQCRSEQLFPYTSRWSWGALQGAWSRREFVIETPAPMSP